MTTEWILLIVFSIGGSAVDPQPITITFQTEQECRVAGNAIFKTDTWRSSSGIRSYACFSRAIKK